MSQDTIAAARVANCDADAYRGAMRHVPGAVAVITSSDGKDRNGMTATAVASVSADPPRLLVCLNKSASVTAIVERSRRFAVNFLASDQLDLARRFSTSKMPAADRLDGVALDEDDGVALLLSDATSWFACSVVDGHDYGTHMLFVGDVIAARCTARAPLVYHDGVYATSAAL